MKKKALLTCFSLLLGALVAFGQNNITIGTPGQGGAGTEVTGTWPSGSTVTVYDHMIIPVGQSLTIQEGVNVLIADTALKIELIALGNLYCLGTQENPINITVKSDLVPANNPFPGLWGSIVCDTTCSEMLLLHTNIKYYGGPTNNNSPSVLLNLYKDAAGQTEPYINFRDHNGGKLVVEYCTFSNGLDDGIYIEGGNVIYAHNTTYQQGYSGGDATNLKAGTIADLCYNFYYSPNTNAFKLSNTGSRSPQCSAVVYNNTIVNAGWRRPTVKGGSVWYEAGVIGQTYNTLFVNDRFGIKDDGKQDTACKADYNFYYGYGQTCVNQFNTPTSGLFPHGAHDIYSTTKGDNDPMLVNYPLQTDTFNSTLDPAWDFHVMANSPAIGKGTTNFSRHFGTSGLTILGVEYKSPDPSTIIGAFDMGSVTSVSLNENTLSLHVGDTATLTASIAPFNAVNKAITWSSDNTDIATVINGKVTAVSIGNAHVIVTTTDGGFVDTCTVTVNAVAAVKTNLADQLQVYPNPVTDNLHIQLPSQAGNTEVSVYSVTGAKVMEFTFSQDHNLIVVPVSSLANGMYYVSVKNINLSKSMPFIKK